MHQEALEHLAALRPAIKQRWASLLRSAPKPSPLAHPDLVVYLLDDLLDRLEDALVQPDPHQNLRSLPTAGPNHACGCGLSPLLPCFITGEQALIEVAAPVLGSDLNFLLARYHDIATAEMTNFCGVCVHRDSPACPARALSS